MPSYSPKTLILIFFLLVITGAGMALRIYKIGDMGLFSRDEAWYLYSAKAMIGGQSDSDSSFYEKTSLNNSAGKPAYITTLAIASIFTKGIRDITGFYVSIFFGTLTVPMFFFLNRVMQKNIAQSFFSSLLLATSLPDIFYSRIVFPISILMFLFLACLFFYQKFILENKQHSLFLCGFTAGLASSVHGIFLIAVSVLSLFIFQHLLKKDSNLSITAKCYAFTCYVLGLAVMPLFWEFFYFLYPYFFPGHTISLTGSFVKDLFRHGTDGMIGQPSIFESLYKLLLYLTTPLVLASAPVICLAILGCVLGFRSLMRDKKLSFAAVVFLMVSFLYLAIPLAAMRLCSFFVPLYWFAAGEGFGWLREKCGSKRKKVFTVLFFLITLASNIHFIRPIYAPPLSSGWKDAAQFLATFKNTTSIMVGDACGHKDVSDYALLSFYLDDEIPFVKEEQTEFFVNYGNFYCTSNISRTMNEMILMATFKNRLPLFKPHLALIGTWPIHPLWRYGKNYYPRSMKEHDDEIRIYKFKAGAHNVL